MITFLVLLLVLKNKINLVKVLLSIYGVNLVFFARTIAQVVFARMKPFLTNNYFRRNMWWRPLLNKSLERLNPVICIICISVLEGSDGWIVLHTVKGLGLGIFFHEFIIASTVKKLALKKKSTKTNIGISIKNNLRNIVVRGRGNLRNQ